MPTLSQSAHEINSSEAGFIPGHMIFCLMFSFCFFGRDAFLSMILPNISLGGNALSVGLCFCIV